MKSKNALGSVLSQLCLAAMILAAGSPAVRAEPARQEHLPRILVLATGGTIAGTASARSAIAYNAGGVLGEQLVASVPGLDQLAVIKAEQVSNIGSQDMNSQVWTQLAKRIKQAFDRNEADGVVITHGTDTMEETAFFLDNVLDVSKPVVLVGAMRPSSAVSADGPGNLYEAVEVAASEKSRNRGVLVVMNDTIHTARVVTKTNTTSVQTFLDPNDGPAGLVDPASIHYFMPAAPRHKLALALPSAGLPRVEIVYAHADMDADQIEAAVHDHAKGIVLAGVGDGNASQAALGALEDAARHGIVVVRSSRVGGGLVNRNVEVSDDKAGFVVSYDLNPQKARLLTQLLIGNGITTPANVQQAFDDAY